MGWPSCFTFARGRVPGPTGRALVLARSSGPRAIRARMGSPRFTERDCDTECPPSGGPRQNERATREGGHDMRRRPPVTMAITRRGPPVRVAISRDAATRSVQHMRRIVRDAMAMQEVEIFASVGLFPVMGLLVPDVIPEGLVVKPGDRERTIPMLPFEVFSVRKGLMNPASGVRLDCGD